MDGDPINRQAIHEELERARSTIHALVATSLAVDLRRSSSGTRWTNQQLLFHMLFGYMLVRNLLILVRFFGRLPNRYSRAFAALLGAGTRPFHTINYLGSLGGARVLGHARMERTLDRVVACLVNSMNRQRTADLDRGMHFPVGWDPYFRTT